MGWYVHSIPLFAMEVNGKATVVVCAHSLEGSSINRQLWQKPRSSFYYETDWGWSDAQFKWNYVWVGQPSRIWQRLLKFSGILNRLCMCSPTYTRSYCLPKYLIMQQFLHIFSVVLDSPSCQHLSKHRETPNLNSPMNAGLKPPRKLVCNPYSNPHCTRHANAITHIILGFNAD